MKKIYILTVTTIMTLIIVSSCKTSQVVANKGGAQLWAENCTRCHYAPSSIDFNDHEWDVIGMHMQVRAQLTKTEREKIITFLTHSN